MQLAALEQLFWRAMRETNPPSELDREFASKQGLSALDRISIYRAMYWSRQVEALRETFPKVAQHVGQPDFTGLALRYLRAHPSRTPTLERIGRHFPSFLESCSQRQRFVPHLAELEWTRLNVLLAAEPATLADPRDINAESFASSTLTFVPALAVIKISEHALNAFACDPCALAENPATDSSSTERDVAVWRSAYKVRHAVIADDEILAIERAQRGLSLAEICEVWTLTANATERAHATLASWFRRGWIATIQS